jgi:hypothetical protein
MARVGHDSDADQTRGLYIAELDSAFNRTYKPLRTGLIGRRQNRVGFREKKRDRHGYYIRYNNRRLVLELLVDFSLDQRQTLWKKKLTNAHRQLQAFINAILPIISTKLRNPRSSGYTQQTCSQTEGLARVFVTRWKTTARSDRGV